MYKIGEFSILAKTTIKTLRYYEKENLLIPTCVSDNGYRYYETKQLMDLAKIISLRQIGFSIEEIKEILCGKDLESMLNKRVQELESNLKEYNNQLTKTKYLMEGYNMKYEVIEKVLPEYTVYYKEGVIEDFSKLVQFILSSSEDCLRVNPNIKCVEPDYCYLNYLDGEYKEKNIKVRYAQAVLEKGKESDTIKFETLKPVKAMCIYHSGSYEGLRAAYGFIMKYIEDNGYEVADHPRERYIDGMWNKENEEEWLTEIQVPIKKKN